MASPVSPSALFRVNEPPSPLQCSSSSSSIRVPHFPIEIQKRILYHALHLSPYDPSDLTSVGGASSRQRDVRRVVERLNTHRAALTLMGICKAWKKEAAEYLYAEPHLTPSNLFLFAHALSQGDKKWSDINLHPHSTPGRYVHSLDLTHLRDGYETPHPTALSRVLREVFPLIPNLTHLKLPTGSLVPFEEIRRAPFAGRLKVLEGVQVNYEMSLSGDVDPVVRLLRSLPNLEVLSLIGPGDIEAPESFELDEASEDPLELDKLRSLTLTGTKSGVLLHTLVSSELPSLQHLALTSYADCAGDLTHAFQAAHGHKITALTYLLPREWPGFQALPPIETLELHPELRHLSYGLVKDLNRLYDILACRNHHHPLSTMTVSKWTSTPADRFDPTQHDAGANGSGASRLMGTLVDAPPKALRSITIDGHRWARSDMGIRALQTGDSGEMRSWAEKLRVNGISLLDMDGNASPVYSPAGPGAMYGLMGVGENKGRRRSSAQWGDIFRTRAMRDALDDDGG